MFLAGNQFAFIALKFLAVPRVIRAMSKKLSSTLVNFRLLLPQYGKTIG